MLAKRMLGEEADAGLFPCRVIAALAGRGAVAIMFGLPGTVGGNHMLATVAIGHDATASTKRGRAHRH
jgi:hypothetical protein